MYSAYACRIFLMPKPCTSLVAHSRGGQGRGEVLLRALHFKRLSLARDSLRDSPRDKAPRAPDFLKALCQTCHVCEEKLPFLENN